MSDTPAIYRHGSSLDHLTSSNVLLLTIVTVAGCKAIFLKSRFMLYKLTRDSHVVVVDKCCHGYDDCCLEYRTELYILKYAM